MKKTQTGSGWELKILFFFALVYILSITQPIFFPIILAFFLYLLLQPLMELLLKYLKLPKVLASLLITAGILSVISIGVSFLMGPASNWIDHAADNVSIFEKKFSFIKKPLGKMSEAVKKAQNITSLKKETPTVAVQSTESLGYSIFDLTTNAIITISIIIVLLFFFLIYLNRFFLNLQKVIRNRRINALTNDFLLCIEQEISNYFIVFTIICICLGAVIGSILWLLEVPNAVLWGVMATILNFIPYIGPAIGIFVVFFVSVLTFDNYFSIFLPPLLYFFVIIMEGQIITPILIGHRLNLNPLIVFLNIFFWGWLWGISGILISIPLLSMIKILMNHIPGLEKYSLLLE